MAQTAVVRREAANQRLRERPQAAALFWLIVLIPLAGLALSFVLARNRAFAKRADEFWITAESVVFESSHRPCDVLIFGDSTVMTGIDPGMIARRTRMSVCNASLTSATLWLAGLGPLNGWLSRNPRPKFLVLQFSHSNLQSLPTNRHESQVDGYILYLRYYGLRKALVAALHHSDYLTMVPRYVYLDSGKQLLLNLIHWNGLPDPGQSFIRLPLPPLTSCPAPPPFVPANRAWISRLRREYSSRADHVLINVAPTPQCDPQLPRLEEDVSGLTDNGVPAYPYADFVDDAHLSPAGAARLSEETAEQILRLEKRQLNATIAANDAARRIPEHMAH